jgi:hypothetical protein
VSWPINPPVGHLRYATRLLRHHNASLCTISLVSTTPFFRDVTPCDWVIGSRRLQRTQCLHFQGSWWPRMITFLGHRRRVSG